MVDQPVDERQLCSKCHTFWGTERTKYMCSKCYKDHILTTDTMTKGKLKAGEEEKKRETPGKAKEEEKTIIELPEQVPLNIQYIYIYIYSIFILLYIKNLNKSFLERQEKMLAMSN